MQRLLMPSAPLLQRKNGVDSDSEDEDIENVSEDESEETQEREKSDDEVSRENNNQEAEDVDDEAVDRYEGVERLRRANKRNRNRKSNPIYPRHMLPYQQVLSYSTLGTKVPIEIPDKDDNFHLSGGLSKGTAGQPNFTTEMSRYDNARIA